MLAGKVHSTQSAEALEKLCRTYWSPLYFFVRGRGYGAEDAQDLTQQFFLSLLSRNDFAMVDPARGKFRTFLLTALTHFLANEWDRSRAAKRGGGKTIISLDSLAAEEAYKFEPSHDVSPDQLFDKRWAVAILDLALLQLQKEFTEQEREQLFEQLKPFLTNDPSEGDYAGVAIQTGMSSQNVAVMVFRMRKRYGELVRSEVSQTVASPLDLEQEMRHLFQTLNL
ncbi:MAG: hypothetical protein JWQ71_1242 [Pedosphaera sp.]|nr:hypothetical protein [Pedosphaera sp.]